MGLAVDLVTGTRLPKYTAEIVARLPRETDCHVLETRGYGVTQLATAYRMVHHPVSVRRRRRQGTILHVDTQLLAYVLAFGQRSPTVLTCHDLAQFHPEYDDPSYFSRRGLAGRAFLRMLARGIRRADRIVTVSAFVRDELLRSGLVNEAKIDVVPNGVDLNAYRPRPKEECTPVLARYGLPGNRRLVLYVGTNHPRKNLAGLLRAFARFRAKDSLLVSIGIPREPQHSRLLALAVSLGITSRIAFVRDVAEADLPLLYGASDVLVLPSFYEGFGLPPLEAMACGIPVAVARAASLPEVVGDAGLYFDPRDHEDIAAEVDRLLTDKALREDLRDRGLARARNFPWEGTVEGILSTYRHALEEST